MEGSKSHEIIKIKRILGCVTHSPSFGRSLKASNICSMHTETGSQQPKEISYVWNLDTDP